MEKFLIPTRHGLLEIHVPSRDGFYCNLLLPGNKELVLRNSKGHGQLLLPFKEITLAEQFLHDAEATTARIRWQLFQIPLHQKMLLEFCIKGGQPAVELFEDCPALALLLAQRVSYDSAVNRQEQLVALAGKKRTEILNYCKFPEAPWIARVLKKIPAMHTTSFLLEGLKEILARNDHNQISVIRHLPTISRLVIEVLNNPKQAALVTWNFYQSASSYPQTNGNVAAEYLLDEIIRIINTEQTREMITVPRIGSVRDLQQIHDIVTEQYVELQDGAYFDMVFGKPPLADLQLEIKEGKVGIFALRNGKDLFLEGKKMRHCIASYSSRINIRRDLYAYHVCSPDLEEATILVAGNNEITFRLLEIQGVANTDVSPAMMFFVEEWLHEHNKALEEIHGRE